MNVAAIIKNLSHKPSYSIMRGFARFPFVIHGVSSFHRMMKLANYHDYESECQSRLKKTLFTEINIEKFTQRLNHDGVAFGLRLPDEIVREIFAWAIKTPCFADRDVRYGFNLENHHEAEKVLQKPIMSAQYFNVSQLCPSVARLVTDPALKLIAARYLNTQPKFVGTNLWWTFPVQALEKDRDRHAHLYHRDLDDFRFFKFFFYLADVNPNEGAYVCVLGSHTSLPIIKKGDRYNIRRYSDEEIHNYYSADKVEEGTVSAGVPAKKIGTSY